MASSASPLRSLTRNLGMATTGITVLITGLASLEIFVFLEPARLPLFVLTAVAWGGYYMVTTLINSLKSGKLIISAEGPGEEIVQKATYFSFQQQEEFAEGSKADEAFVRAEQAYLAYQYSRAATNYQESLAAKASVPAYVNAAISLLNSSLFEQAEELLGMGLALAERLELRPFQAACHANIGIIHARTGRWDSAVEACEQASGLFRQLGDGRGRADVQLTLGNIQANRGDWEAARRSFESALKRYEIAHSELGRANGQGNLGNMCMFQGELEEALRYHRKALEIHEQIGNPLGRANALSNIGTVRFRMTEFGEADTAYDTALGIYREIGASLGEASALMNLGNVRFKQGKLKGALDMYERTLAIHQEIGNSLGQANALTNLGSLQSKMGNHSDALEAAHQARSLYGKVGARTEGFKSVEILIKRLEAKQEGHDARSSDAGKAEKAEGENPEASEPEG